MIVKFPSLTTVPEMPLIVTSESLATPASLSVVVNEIAPVNAWFSLRVMVLSLTSAVKEDVPPTVRIQPLQSVMSLPAVTAKFPPTVDVAKSNAVVPLSRVALALDPVVFKLTVPPSAFVPLRVIVALLALVVNDEVPVTARATF